jgi:hypothetical protein
MPESPPPELGTRLLEPSQQKKVQMKQKFLVETKMEEDISNEHQTVS